MTEKSTAAVFSSEMSTIFFVLLCVFIQIAVKLKGDFLLLHQDCLSLTSRKIAGNGAKIRWRLSAEVRHLFVFLCGERAVRDSDSLFHHQVYFTDGK